MTRRDNLQNGFAERRLQRFGLQLYRAIDAIDFVRRCRHLRLRILGIDAFLVFPNGVQPVMEHSIDFSSEGNIDLLNDSWSAAERFLSERDGTSLFFEIVVDSPAV